MLAQDSNSECKLANEDPDTKTLSRGFLKDILKEPLLHFLALAGLLFVLQAVFAGDTREVISVDADTQEYLFQQRQDLTLSPVSEEEKRQIVEDFVEEEILVREANKRGFADSSRIRRLLLQNMRFFIAGDLPEPSEGDLRAFFEDNLNSFESPPSLELDHIFFGDPANVPDGLAEKLNGGAEANAFGDEDYTFGRRMRFMDEKRLIAAFGRETASQVLALPPSDMSWHGPFLSEQGTAHFVRVSKRNPPSVPDYDTARDWVSAQWMTTKSRELMEAELATVRPNYRIDVAGRDNE